MIFLVTSLNSGGIENYLLRFLKFYNGNFIPYIICKNGPTGELIEEYNKIEGIKFYPHQIGYINISLFNELYKFIGEVKPLAVCDFTGNFAGIPLLLAKWQNVQTRIAFYRGSTDHFSGSLFKNIYNSSMNRLVKKNATKVLSNSKAALVNFFGNEYSADKRFSVLNNGIDALSFLTDKHSLRKELKLEQEDFVICHVGRFDASKNHKVIMTVAQNLCRSNSNIHFLLCGKNVDINLEQQVKELGLEEKIHLIGYTKNVIQILNTGDCFYFPSITEGQPNALIEALIAGLPFVASNISPIREIIPEKFHNQLVDPNDVNSAAEKILEVKNSTELKESLDLSNWAIENFDAAKLFSQFYNFLFYEKD